MNSLPYDIVLLPCEALAQKAIALSRRLKQYETLFTLEDGTYYPHASFYMVQLKTGDVDSVKKLLADIAAQSSPFDLVADRYDQALGFIDAEYRRTDVLDQLQTAVINAINPIRDGMREKDKVRMLEAEGLTLENYKQYGYRYVGKLFRPHLSITRFTDERSIDITDLPRPSELSGMFDRLGLFEMGDNGTCVRKIAEFTL
jgi:hypothetical protein